METCNYHTQLVSDISVIKNDLGYIKERVCEHIKQGEERGGFRDRVLILENEVAALRKSVWKIGITSGLIGALIGEMTPDVVSWLVGFLK